MRKTLFFLILMATQAMAFAQSATMADELRNSGKIYVVVAILVLILLGVIIYLIRLEKKIKKVEKELEDNVKKGN